MRHPASQWGRPLAAGVAGLALAMGVRAQMGVSVAADSDYRFRGVSLSDSRPSLRMTLNYDAPDGWYAGASATRVEPAQGERYAQVLGYAGWVTRFDNGRRVEFGASFSHFTGDSSYDFAEAYAALLAERWSVRVYYAPDYFGRHKQTVYAELNAHLLLNEHARLFGHVGVLAPLGRSSGSASGGDDASRARGDLRAGAGLMVRDWDLQLAWVAATRGDPYPAVYDRRRTAWVLGAAYSF